MKIDDSVLEYNFYQDSCPNAEPLVESMMRSIYKKQPDVAPSLLRLMFHDCFIQGCDASVLLDSPISGNQSEKDTVPNQTLKGFDVIEKIISKVEEECPPTVSCADILVLSAREGILLTGGPCNPCNPLTTGRRDSLLSFPEIVASEVPSPNDDLSKTITLFSSRGFNQRESVSLLGAHNIGKVPCHFFCNRLHNHLGTGLPDPALDPGTLNLMSSRCENNNDQTDEPSINMDSEGTPKAEFGTHYYKNLVQGKGILHADQQLMASNETARLVEIFASDGSLFQQKGILLAGGPYYPLTTGRREILLSFPEIVASEFPSPSDDLSKTITLFASRGFNERETVSLLGAHNIGKVHCHFFHNRLHNHSGTDLPDPALDPGTLNLMRSRCDNSNDQTEEPSINMDSEGALEPGFGTDYYKNLVQGKGILHADQHLMVCEEAANLVASRGFNESETVSHLGFGHSNSIGIAMKCVEGIVCVADSKVTREDDPNINETTSKLHKFGDNVVLITLGNAHQCHLLLDYLREAIEMRAAATPVKPPLTLFQIAAFCTVFFEQTNDRDNCGAFSRVIICGLDPAKKIYCVQSTNTDIEEAGNYVMGGSGSVGLSPMGRFRIPSNTILFTMVDAMVECTNAALCAIELHPQTCGKPVMMCEIRETEDYIVDMPYVVGE